MEKINQLPHEKSRVRSSTERIISNKDYPEGFSLVEKSVDLNGDGQEQSVMHFTPEGAASGQLVYFSGFSDKAANNIDSLGALASETNHEIVTWNNLEGHQIGDVRFDEDSYAGVDIPEEQLKKVISGKQLLNHEGVHSADIIGHSEGCIHAVISAYMYPHTYGDVLLVNPAGITKQRKRDLILGGIKEGMSSIKRTDFSAFGKEVSASELPMLYESIKGISKISLSGMIPEMLRELQERGTKVGIVHTDDDSMFAQDEISKTLFLNDDNPDTNLIHHYVVKPGDHNDMVMPKTMREVIAQAFDEMKQERKEDIEDNETEVQEV